MMLIRENNRITIPELAKKMKVHEKTVKRDLEKLKGSGDLQRIGPDKGGYWEIIQK